MVDLSQFFSPTIMAIREAYEAKERQSPRRGHLGGYKIPKGIDLHTEPLPKSGPGKFLKRQLREPYWKGVDRRVN